MFSLSGPFRQPIAALCCLGVLLSFGGIGAPVFAATAKPKDAPHPEQPQWREAQSEPGSPTTTTFLSVFPDKQWWETFQDPYLNRYIQEALSANLDLKIAYQRIEEARQLARQSLGNELPRLGIGANFSRQKNSRNFIPNPNTLTAQTGNTTGRAGGTVGGGSLFAGQTFNVYTVPLTASYELDLWQRNRDRTRALNQETEAVRRDFQTVSLIVASEVANAYFSLMAYDRLIELRQALITAAEADVTTTQNRVDIGLDSDEELAIKQGLLGNYKAQLQEFRRLQAAQLNRLAVLMGKTPMEVASLERSPIEQCPLPDAVAAGVPSELLFRRPDILANEERLERARLEVRVARKEFLPTINITGQFGFTATRLKDLFDWESHLASIAASLAQSLFTGGSRTANLRAFKSRYEQQLLQYQQTILTAYQEAEDAMAALKAHRNAYAEYANSFSALNRRATILNNRLNQGVIAASDLNPLLVELRLAEEGLVQSKFAVLTDTLSLYRALGGGY